MTVSVPTTQSLSNTIIADIESKLGQTIPLLPKSFSRVFSKAVAGADAILYRYMGWLSLQMWIRYASASEVTLNGKTFIPLVEYGRQLGVGDPTDATRAELTITVNVTNVSASNSLAGGSQLLRTTTGVIYLTLSSVVLSSSTVAVNVRAVSDQEGGDGSGAIGNLQVGDTLEFANPLPNVQRTATVSAVVRTAADAEDLDTTYRDRVLDRARNPPQGGAYADYRIWAEGVEGIVNAYPYTGSPGEVDIYIEATEASSGSADGIPTAAQITAVSAAIELDVAGVPTRRPANAAINVLPITRTGFGVTITSLVADDLATVKSDLEDAVDEYLRSREPYIVGLSVLPRTDRITFGEIASTIIAVVSAAGGTLGNVTIQEAGTTILNRTLGEGEKAKLDTSAVFYV